MMLSIVLRDSYFQIPFPLNFQLYPFIALNKKMFLFKADCFVLFTVVWSSPECSPWCWSGLLQERDLAALLSRQLVWC